MFVSNCVNSCPSFCLLLTYKKGNKVGARQLGTFRCQSSSRSCHDLLLRMNQRIGMVVGRCATWWARRPRRWGASCSRRRGWRARWPARCCTRCPRCPSTGCGPWRATRSSRCCCTARPRTTTTWRCRCWTCMRPSVRTTAA